MRILITCPPMINMVNNYEEYFKKYKLDYFCPKFRQVLSVEELIELVPHYDGWIIGDDPATREVFESGANGKLKAAVKWGVGVDNVDFQACSDLNIPITNIPNVFGEEVSDIGIGMILNLTRKIHEVDLETKKGNWIKPIGVSLVGKKICLIGFGDIGRTMARKLLAFNMNIYVSDPGFKKIGQDIVCIYNNDIKIDDNLSKVNIVSLDEALDNSDFICITCSLNKATYHLINKEKILKTKPGVIIINIARGPVICEDDVIELLESGHIGSVGLDVFEIEPLPNNSKLRNFKQNIYGSHNGSNTKEAVNRTSYIALETISKYLNLV